MKRIVTWILLAALFWTGLSFPAESRAESDHPITLTIKCDPAPELEGAGTIPDLLFTIRNTGDEDYTIFNAKLSGGFENDRKEISDTEVTVLAGGSKEFHLTDVPVSEDQLDRQITYRLSWEEHKTLIDDITGEATFVSTPRETTATIMIERFTVPELTVTASCEKTTVRVDETFNVVYKIENDTAFDITGIRLYDSAQSKLTIPLPSGELSSGESMSVTVSYTMTSEDMTFEPCVEYLSHRREMTTTAEKKLTVEAISIDLLVETELRSATEEGTVLVVKVTNRGNRPITDIRVYDEINTQIEEPFILNPDEYHTVICTIRPAVSSDIVRTVHFHVTALDYFGEEIRIEDPGLYKVVPYLEPDSVRLVLSAVLQSPYYNEDGKLCASIQFIIRNNGDVKVHNVALTDLSLFGQIKTYDELLVGDTYLTQTYQLDGVKELRFQVTALDPAGEPCSSDIVRLDLSGLKDLADQKNHSVLVYTQNEYMQDIDSKYTGILRIATIIGLSVAALCAIVCIILYAVEIRIRGKLPGEFEDEMERVLRSTKRRAPKQLFTDAPTEQFGYVAPIKLRNYGELTEEEAKARRELYAKRLEETIRREGGKTADRPKTPAPERIDDDGTRVIPIVRRTAPEPKAVQASPAAKAPSGQKPAASAPDRASETVPGGTQVIPTARRTVQKTEKPSEAKHDGTRVIPTARPNPVPTAEPVLQTPEAPVVPPVIAEPDAEPVRIFEPRRSRPAPIPEPAAAPDPVGTVIARPPEQIHAEPIEKPEPEPEEAPDPVGTAIARPPEQPHAEPIEKPEPEPAGTPDPVGTVIARPPEQIQAEPIEKPEPEPAGTPDPVGTVVARPPEQIHAEPIEKPEPEPAAAPDPVGTVIARPPEHVLGPRRASEKMTPSRRPVVLHPIRRIGG